jgi:hypothetical protein
MRWMPKFYLFYCPMKNPTGLGGVIPPVEAGAMPAVAISL